MEGVREVNSTHFLVPVSSCCSSMMTLTAVRDILLGSGIVLIQDIFSRNERFVHNGNFCKCSLLISLFYDECRFFRDSFEPFHALFELFHALLGNLVVLRNILCFSADVLLCSMLTTEIVLLTMLVVLPIHMNAAAKDSYMCMS